VATVSGRHLNGRKFDRRLG